MNQAALRKDLEKFVQKFKEKTGDVDINFHDEDPCGYLAGSPFVLTFEGGEMYYGMNNHSMFGWKPKDYINRGKWVKKFNTLVEKHGYYAEMGTAWAVGFYPKG